MRPTNNQHIRIVQNGLGWEDRRVGESHLIPTQHSDEHTETEDEDEVVYCGIWEVIGKDKGDGEEKNWDVERVKEVANQEAEEIERERIEQAREHEHTSGRKPEIKKEE